MFRVELAKAVRRWRTWALAAALGAIPALIVVGVAVSPPRRAGDGPPFLLDILRSGYFAPLTALAAGRAPAPHRVEIRVGDGVGPCGHGVDRDRGDDLRRDRIPSRSLADA